MKLKDVVEQNIVSEYDPELLDVFRDLDDSDDMDGLTRLKNQWFQDPEGYDLDHWFTETGRA